MACSLAPPGSLNTYQLSVRPLVLPESPTPQPVTAARRAQIVTIVLRLVLIHTRATPQRTPQTRPWTNGGLRRWGKAGSTRLQRLLLVYALADLLHELC